MQFHSLALHDFSALFRVCQHLPFVWLCFLSQGVLFLGTGRCRPGQPSALATLLWWRPVRRETGTAAANMLIDETINILDEKFC